MFIRSAAMDTLQGKAIHGVNEKFGEDFRQWGGRETLGIPVCKKKYAPFAFKVVPVDDKGENEGGGAGRKRRSVEVQVERMYGCRIHSNLRKAVIEQHGERKGWEPFGQWSLRKAQQKARLETEKLNRSRSSVSEGDTSEEGWTSDDAEDKTNLLLPTCTVCNNGNCTWKMKEKYDDIYAEIHGRSESDEE